MLDKVQSGMCTAKTQISLCTCTAWSESLLGMFLDSQGCKVSSCRQQRLWSDNVEGWSQDCSKSDGCFSQYLISSPWRRYDDYNICFCKQWKFRCQCSYEQWHLNLHCLQRGQNAPKQGFQKYVWVTTVLRSTLNVVSQADLSLQWAQMPEGVLSHCSSIYMSQHTAKPTIRPV